MSDNNNQKVMTKYDQKMQKRKEQKEKDKKSLKRAKTVAIVVVAVIVCLAVGLGIHSYSVRRETFVTVNGEEINRVKFDYYYSTIRNEHMATYGSMMAAMGQDVSIAIENEMMDETMTYKDYWQKNAVSSIVQSQKLMQMAEVEGFTHDVEPEYREFLEKLKSSAAEYGYPLRSYVKQVYGPFATPGNIEEYVKEGIFCGAYYTKLEEAYGYTEEDIQEYYEENSKNYDFVNYRQLAIEADLPTEDGVEVSEEEEAAALAEAKALAEQAAATVMTKGELKEGVGYYVANFKVRDWLFEADRKQGDVTVIEDEATDTFYVVGFESRYLDQSATADVQIIITYERDGQEILDEWKRGEATAESFAELCLAYSEDPYVVETLGKYQALARGSFPEEVDDWILDPNRKEGDTVALYSEEKETHYVIYYVQPNEASWRAGIKTVLSGVLMSDFMTALLTDMQVEDPNGNLRYLKLEALAAGN